MDKLASNVAVLTHFFLCKECFSGQANLLLLLHVANNEHRVSVVPSDDFINVDVVLHKQWSCRVPSHNPFFSINTTHHVEHLFVVDMVKEPNLRLLWVFFKRNCIAIGYI